MPDNTEDREKTRADRDDAAVRRVEPPSGELGDDALEDVAGGAMCTANLSLVILPGNSTV